MPKVQPGNPDWVEWVQELVDQAEAASSKAAQTYKKAAHSLKSCPITFRHPEQALQLNGIGPKIVDYLVKKLKAQCDSQGIPMPDRVGPASPRKVNKAAAAKAPAKRAAKARAADSDDEIDAREARRQRLSKAVAGGSAASGGLTFNAHPDGHIFNRMADEDDVATGSSKNKGKGKAAAESKEPKSREYIPRQNSGGYAILLALYKNASFEERQTWITKQQIMDDGQEYSNTPFETGTANRGGQAQGGQGFTFSAWNSMKTLTSKDLTVSDNKRPAKFALTSTGYDLAERLAASAGVEVHVRLPSSSASGGGHPSSSGGTYASGSGSAYRPDRFGVGSSGGGGARRGIDNDDTAYFPGLGNALGASTSGPSVLRNTSIHVAVPQRRQVTPDLFGEVDPAPKSSTTAAKGPQAQEDAHYLEQLRLAIELSKKDAAAMASSDAADSDGLFGVDGSRSASSTAVRANGGGGRSAALNARKAAMGVYAIAAPKANEAPAFKNVDSAFGYFYLTEDNDRTIKRDDAEVSQTDSGDLLFRIEYRVAQDLHPIVRGLKKIEPLSRPTPLPGGMTKSAYIRERVCNDLAPGFPDRRAMPSDPGAKKTVPSDDPLSSVLGGYKAPTKSSKDAMYAPPAAVRILGGDGTGSTSSRGVANVSDILARFKDGGPSLSSSPAAGMAAVAQPVAPARRPPPAAPPPAVPARRPAPVTAEPSVSPKRPRLSASDILAAAPRALGPTSSENPLQASFEANGFARKGSDGQPIVNRHPLDPVRDHVSAAPYVHTHFAPIVWPKGSFQVYLIVDSREGTREAGKRVELCEKMEREGVRVDGKMMPLGDMIWVARKVDPVTKRPTGADDVVLDAIVERKRLDDLCSSIIDGRYVGQKFRLKDSGITHRIYLIEKYDVAAQYEKFGKQIWASKSQLQVNDGFYVHESANIADTISYLRKRTQVMSEIYETQDLHIIPDNRIDRSTYLSLQQHLRSTQPAIPHLTTYASFCALNRSDAALTVRTQWASMIQRVSGVGAEKAVQFLGRWETPRSFWEDTKRHEAEVEAENRRLDEEEEDARAQNGKPPPKGKPKKVKRPKAEDYVFAELDDGGTRGIKGKLGAKIWELFRTEGKYALGS
ncbi:hypothetical protein JCM10908_004779 [Rhodotorula pacifica]|uniref:Mus81p n=1 Tax=Rhodotorula pacifica TaxID=1495444 RepID=UPI0031732E15